MLEGRWRIIFAKRVYILVGISIAIYLLMVWPATTYASGESVEKVTVNVMAAEPPPERIAKRMTTSVATVGEQMLAGRTLVDVKENQAGYEKLIREIFDRVLVGYSVETVTITPGETTNITVAITPWGDVVRDVSLEIEVNGLSPELTAMIKTDIGKIDDQVGNVLIGLPVNSVDWAGGVSKTVIREILADKLPEFRSNLEITTGQHTLVKISLVPQGTVINDVNLSLRSRTIPNILLTEAKPAAQEAANMLRGLPVAFVERHKDYFTSKITTAATNHPIAKQYGLTLEPTINPGSETSIVLNAETNKYKISLEGSLDIGREDDNAFAKLHVGKFINKRDEAFMELRFIPSNVSWKFEPGWGHKFTETTFAGVRYNLTDDQGILWLNHYVGPNWMIRLERTPEINYNEFGVKYKMHEFLSAEYVITKKENWLRLVANL